MTRAVLDPEHERAERRIGERRAADPFGEERTGLAGQRRERLGPLQIALDEGPGRGPERGQPRVDDHETVDEGRLVAQRLAGNPDVVAVIGHLHSYVTGPAAAIYDMAGMVTISPTATDPGLTTKVSSTDIAGGPDTEHEKFALPTGVTTLYMQDDQANTYELPFTVN